jgi:hypothetical protein
MVVVDTLLVNWVKMVVTITIMSATTHGGNVWKLMRKLPIASDKPDSCQHVNTRIILTYSITRRDALKIFLLNDKHVVGRNNCSRISAIIRTSFYIKQ